MGFIRFSVTCICVYPSGVLGRSVGVMEAHCEFPLAGGEMVAGEMSGVGLAVVASACWVSHLVKCGSDVSREGSFLLQHGS